MLTVSQYKDTALSTAEITAVMTLLNQIWPSKDKTLSELVEAFPERARSLDLEQA